MLFYYSIIFFPVLSSSMFVFSSYDSILHQRFNIPYCFCKYNRALLVFLRWYESSSPWRALLRALNLFLCSIKICFLLFSLLYIFLFFFFYSLFFFRSLWFRASMAAENPNQSGTSISNQSKNVAQGENPTHSFLYLHLVKTPQLLMCLMFLIQPITILGVVRSSLH